jgi:hypothetical protein
MGDLGFLQWEDPYEWTETNHAARNHAIRYENRIFKHIAHASGSERELQKEKHAYMAAYGRMNTMKPIRIPQDNPHILISPRLQVEGVYYWKHVRDPKWKYADDLDFWSVQDAPYVAYTQDVVAGKLDYTLHVKTPTSHWTHKKNGGDTVAIMNHRVYFIEGDEPLHYNRLVSLSLYTGQQRKVIYEEKNPSIVISLVKQENRTLFLIGEDAGYQRLWWITPTGSIKRLDADGVSFKPVGCSKDGRPVYFVRQGDFTKPWTLVGHGWKLNREIERSGIDFCSMAQNVLISRHQGLRTVWNMSTTSEPKRLHSGFFTPLPFTDWPFWRGDSVLTAPIWVRGPSRPPYKFLVAKSEIYVDSEKIRPYAEETRGESMSPDGLRVGWLLLTSAKSQRKPRRLMVAAYGAYGTSTNLDTTRWIPWLDAGWAVALAFVRGGGDSNESWAELGRMSGKLFAVGDFEACIKDLQRRTHCGPEHTCIFGRSAGGLLIGNLLSKYPTGDLFHCVYAEAPYVDLLKTASNPALPLTEYEYKEFANPRKGPAEFEQALRMSPIHSLPAGGAPGVHVLCRSGKNDIQVYPYEALKWILTLRGNREDTTKILHVNSQYHSTYGAEMYLEYAEDFLIINNWLK